MPDEIKNDLDVGDAPADLSRRSFVQVASGVLIGGAAVVAAQQELVQLTLPGDQPGGRRAPHGEYPAKVSDIVLNVNGTQHPLRVAHHRSLLTVLRDDLGLTGTKKSCNL